MMILLCGLPCLAFSQQYAMHLQAGTFVPNESVDKGYAMDEHSAKMQLFLTTAIDTLSVTFDPQNHQEAAHNGVLSIIDADKKSQWVEAVKDFVDPDENYHTRTRITNPFAPREITPKDGIDLVITDPKGAEVRYHGYLPINFLEQKESITKTSVIVQTVHALPSKLPVKEML